MGRDRGGHVAVHSKDSQFVNGSQTWKSRRLLQNLEGMNMIFAISNLPKSVFPLPLPAIKIPATRNSETRAFSESFFRTLRRMLPVGFLPASRRLLLTALEPRWVKRLRVVRNNPGEANWCKLWNFPKSSFSTFVATYLECRPRRFRNWWKNKHLVASMRWLEPHVYRVPCGFVVHISTRSELYEAEHMNTVEWGPSKIFKVWRAQEEDGTYKSLSYSLDAVGLWVGMTQDGSNRNLQ